MRYSTRDNSYKVTFPIDITDVELHNLFVDVSEEYRKAKINYLKLELAELELEEEVV
jgi:cytidylate kinase